MPMLALFVATGALLHCHKRNPVKKDEPVITWTRAFGSNQIEQGQSVALTSDGGYLIAGYTQNMTPGSADFCLLATDAKGDSLWSRVWGNSAEDIGMSIVADGSGGYLLVGMTESEATGIDEIYMARIDGAGGTVWEKTLSPGERQWAMSVAKTNDSGFVLAGGLYTSDPHHRSWAYLVRINSQGDTLWTRKYAKASAEVATSVISVRDGGYVLAGASSNGYNRYDGYLVKTDAIGDTVWTRTFGGAEEDIVNSVTETVDGSYVAVGHTVSSGAGSKDIWVVKFSSTGELIWERTFGEANWDHGRSVAATPDGGCIVVGTLFSNGREVYLIKLDAAGDSLWTQLHGVSGGEFGMAVALTPDGGYIVAGVTHSPEIGHNTYADIYLIKTDAHGKVSH